MDKGFRLLLVSGKLASNFPSPRIRGPGFYRQIGGHLYRCQAAVISCIQGRSDARALETPSHVVQS